MKPYIIFVLEADFVEKLAVWGVERRQDVTLTGTSLQRATQESGNVSVCFICGKEKRIKKSRERLLTRLCESISLARLLLIVKQHAHNMACYKFG